MNPTFTSKGGFRIIINGITIYKVFPVIFCSDGELEKTKS